MSRKRLLASKRKRLRSAPMEIDITSLLDILVILLLFLLKSYNSSGVPLTIPDGITLPLSESKSINTPGIMIQVSKNKIWVDNKEVLNSEEVPNRLYDHGGRRIIPLYNELIKMKEEIKNVAENVPNAKKFTGVTNLIVDKEVKYNYIKKLMYTCAQAGLKKFNFVVMGEQI